MPWLILLHIAALVVWCGLLLYLPAAIAASTSRASAEATAELFYAPHSGMSRTLFTTVATPAALLTIVTGTLVFLVDVTLGGWLVAKLTAVSGLVLCHAACGALILQVERDRARSVGLYCALVGALSVLLILTIAWLVLGKPF